VLVYSKHSIFELELSKNGEFCFFRDPENVDARGETNSLFPVRLLIKCFTIHLKAKIEKKTAKKLSDRVRLGNKFAAIDLGSIKRFGYFWICLTIFTRRC